MEYMIEDTKSRFAKPKIVLFCCIIFQLILYLLPIRYGDGYFCDELYQIAMSHHICWGGVDVPPLTPFLLDIIRHLIGISLYALRLLPFLGGIAITYIVYLMVKKLNGNFIAYLFALICITLEPLEIAMTSEYTYDYMNRLIWTLMLYTILLLIKTDNKKYWILFGVLAGLGMMTKWSVLFLGVSIIVALILTKRRKDLKSPLIWISGILALCIFSPYLIWNYQHGFPTFEFMEGWSSGHPAGGLEKYFLQLIIFTNLLGLPILLLSIYYFLFNKEGKKFRFIGIAFIVLLILVLYAKPKFYLMTAYFPVLYAGGSVFLGICTEKLRIKWLVYFYAVILTITALLLVPLARPVIPAKTLIKYYSPLISGKEMHYQGSTQLPQWFSDRFGWSALTQRVAEIYNSLPENEKKYTIIYTGKYSLAGAISFFGKKYGLPYAVSGHNQFYLWGPGKSIVKTMIILENGYNKEHYKQLFYSVKHEGDFNLGYGRNINIWLCKDPKFGSIEKIWPGVKLFQ